MPTPSVTFWSRLEPRVREFTMATALRAQLRDPLWLLARQWQVGEFLADDAGSPVKADVRTESTPITTYRPGTEAAFTPLDGVPLEVRVTREDPAPGLRTAAQLGRRFEELLDDEGASGHVGAFRTEYPVSPAPPPDEVVDRAGLRLRSLLAGRALDGNELVAAARDNSADPGQTPPIPSLPTSGARDAATRAIQRLVEYADALFSRGTDGPTWDSTQLDFSFAVGAESDEGAFVLEAHEYRGGDLDWYAFSARPTQDAPAGPAPVAEERTFIPNPITFRGMPNSRWWNFEDGITDFGSLDTEHVDLAKMIVMEFALIYGDDWFELPLSLPTGTLNRVELLLVTDTFGERTLVEAAADDPSAERRWSVFSLSGPEEVDELLFLAPTLDLVGDGPEVEDVLFLRDEMAAMGWAIERALQGPLDAPVDGYGAYFERLAANPPPPPRTQIEGGPDIEYLVGTEVPDNWIPLVPVQTSARSFLFRRGVMGSPGAMPARGRVLEPGHPFYVADEAVPREGAQVSRRVHRARWTDGSTWLWMGREVRVGRGPGWSGLAFDVVRDLERPA